MYSIVTAALWMSVERSSSHHNRTRYCRMSSEELEQMPANTISALPCPALPCHNASSLRGAGQAV